nr:uracil-DNA glycosylase [Anaerobacillus alkalidiazotrophicus]
MMISLKNDWQEKLYNQCQLPYYIQLMESLKSEYETYTIFPPKNEVFNALHYTPFEKTKVVILGQDPYHGQGQAHGLSFSVKLDVKTPPSLKNIYKELHADLTIPISNHGNLEKWASEGVLLLNSVLTVREGKPNSHKGLGWERFTDAVIMCLNKREKPVVFILWGQFAAKKKELITETHHFIIESPHPSPLSASRGFFGSRPFSKTNAYLKSIGELEIDWEIPMR